MSALWSNRARGLNEIAQICLTNAEPAQHTMDGANQTVMSEHGSGQRLPPRSLQNIIGWLSRATAAATGIDPHLTVKRRDPNAPIRHALDDVQCPRCNGFGRTRIMALSRYPLI
jgi:hypothetical protein